MVQDFWRSVYMLSKKVTLCLHAVQYTAILKAVKGHLNRDISSSPEPIAQNVSLHSEYCSIRDPIGFC